MTGMNPPDFSDMPIERSLLKMRDEEIFILNDRLKTVNEKFEQMRKERFEAQGLAERLQAKINAMTSASHMTKDDLWQAVQDLSIKLEPLESENTRLRSKTYRLERDLDTAQKKVKELKSDIKWQRFAHHERKNRMQDIIKALIEGES